MVATEKSLVELIGVDAPPTGIYRDISFTDYLRWPFMSQSVLKKGRKSMKALKCAMDEPVIPTDFMLLGSALHCAFLEPYEMPNKVACWKGDRRAGKEWNAFCEENNGKVILTQGMHAKLVGMIKSLRANKDVRDWFGKVEAVEVSAVGEIEGVVCKGRVDAMTDDPIWDLKKVSSVDDRTVLKTIHDLGYAIQGYMYTTLFNRHRFKLGLVEDSPPYDVRVVELSQTWIELAKKEAVSLLQRVKWCRETKEWPGVSEEVSVLEPPEWLAQASATEITFGGEEVFED